MIKGIAAPCIAQNFPKKDHGKLLGLAKGYLGVGSAFIAIWKTALANNHVDTFMIEYLVFLPIFGVIFAWFLVKLPANMSDKYFQNELDSNGIANYKRWYLLAMLFALYLGSVSVVQDVFEICFAAKVGIFVLSQIIWLLPWSLAIFCHGPFFLSIHNDKYGFKIQHDERLVPNNESNEEYNVGMPQIFATIEFWLLLLPFILICGSGLAFISNIAQIIESASSTSMIDDKNDTISTSLVTIISIGNFFGRIIVGYLSDHFQHRFHRIFWMIPSCVGMCISTLFVYFIGTSPIFLFFVAALFIGIWYGWIVSTVIASCSDLWGTRYLSGNYAALDTAPAIGQVIFSNLIFTNLYDSEHRPIDGDVTKCYGDECYRFTFLICAGASLIAFFMSLCLWIIVKKRERIRGQDQ